MIVLLDTSQNLEQCETEIGLPVGQLITPLTRFSNRGGTFAIDNGAFSGFDRKGFQSLLAREWDNRSRCLFVAAPDIVGNARRTLELFDHWGPKLEGWPVALVIQNGQEDLPIPWDLIDAVFIGGDDKFKTSSEADAVIKTARAMGKWSHVGRVNTPERVEKVMEMGCDSIDGSGIAQYSHMRHRIASTLSSPKLFETSNT